MATFQKKADAVAEKFKVKGEKQTFTQNGTSQQVFMLFRTLTEDERGNRGIQGESVEALIPATLVSTAPLTGSRVTRANDGTWSVTKVDTIQPTTKPILYRLLLER